MSIAAFKEATYQTQLNDTYTSQVKRILNYYMDEAYRQPILDELMKQFFLQEEGIESFYLSKDELRQM